MQAGNGDPFGSRQWKTLPLPNGSNAFRRLGDASCEEGIFISIEHEILMLALS